MDLTRECPYCKQRCLFLRDLRARWTFCSECKMTLQGEGRILTEKEEGRLTWFKVQRFNWDGVVPRPRRYAVEMGGKDA